MTSWSAAMAWSLAALVLASSLFPVTSWDVFWHARVGQDILATGTFPDGDIYSYTRPGGMYVEDEWVFQVLAYLAVSRFGFGILALAKALLMMAAAALLFFEARALSSSTPVAALLVAAGTAAARSRLLERPDAVNLLFFPALLVILSASRRTGQRLLPWLLPPLFGVWANCHSGATLGLIVLCGAVAADAAVAALGGLLPRASAASIPNLALAAACSVPMTLVNPIGPRLLTFPFEVVGVHRTVEWQPAPLAMFPLFYLLGAAFLVTTMVNWRRLDLAELGIFALLLGLGMRHVRMIGIFALASALPLARGAGLLAGRLPIPRSAWAREAWRQRLYAGSSWLLLGWAAHFAFTNTYHGLGMGLARDFYPEQTADFILQERPPAPMWNEFTVGGYLLWRLYPEYRVFIDNREEPYYTLLDEVRDALRSPDAFAQHLDRYHVNFSVVRFTRPDAPIMGPGPDGKSWPRGWNVYFPREAWALVHWDDVAMVFARRAAADPAWLERLEVRAFNPDDFRVAAALASMNPRYGAAVLAEIDRKLREDPGCDRARWLRGVMERSVPPT